MKLKVAVDSNSPVDVVPLLLTMRRATVKGKPADLSSELHVIVVALSGVIKLLPLSLWRLKPMPILVAAVLFDRLLLIRLPVRPAELVIFVLMAEIPGLQLSVFNVKLDCAAGSSLMILSKETLGIVNVY